MKTAISIFLLLSSSPVLAEEIPCDRLVAEFDGFVQSEIGTFQNVAKYFGDNATNWSNAHSLISSGQLTRRTYSGQMATLASNSQKNQDAIWERINKLRPFATDFGASLKKCLEATANQRQ